MSTIAVKLTSLAIRTLAKPIANSIKQQAKEHPRFRAVCIGVAQVVHRTDMRIRLNLLRDNSVIERAEEEEERRKADKEKEDKNSSIAKLAKSAMKDDKTASTKSASDQGLQTPPPSPNSSLSEASPSPPKKKRSSTPHIRPLSDAKAIERGANFISEAFLFSVAGGLILYEALRSRKKELDRRDEVADRLQALEEVDEIWRRKVDMLERSLEAAGIKRMAELPLVEPEVQPTPNPEVAGWTTRISQYFLGSSSSSKNSDKSSTENARAV